MNKDNDLLWAFLLGAFAFGLGFLWPILAFSKQIDDVSQGTLVVHDLETGIKSRLPSLSTKVEIIARAPATPHFGNPNDHWTETSYVFRLFINKSDPVLKMSSFGYQRICYF